MKRRRRRLGTQGILPFIMVAAKKRTDVTGLGGLPLVLETMRALSVDVNADKYLPTPQREGKFSPAEKLESLVLLVAAGGDRVEDIRILAEDKGLECALGQPFPSPDTLLNFLHEFHDEAAVTKAKEDLTVGKITFVPPESAALQGLAAVNKALIAKGAEPGSKKATIDLDGTIIESHKREAKRAYEGTVGYQPLVAVWAEQQLIVADEFRDGNVGGGEDPLTCAQRSFNALPECVTERFFRGDSACYNGSLMRYLRTENISFSISADMTKQLRAAIEGLGADSWAFFEERTNEVLHWAEVVFTPGDCKKMDEPLRYVAFRISPRQGSFFEELGPKYLAVVTNRKADEIAGDALLKWHWKKAGTIEHVHRVLKDELGGGVMPSGQFGTNAGWFRLNTLAFNVFTVLKRRVLPERYREARPKRLRFEVLSLPALLTSHQGTLTLQVSGSDDRVAELIAARGKLLTMLTAN